MSRKEKIQKEKTCEYCGKQYLPFEGYLTKYWRLSRFCNKSCSAFSRREMYSELCKKTGKLPTSENELKKLRVIAKNRPANEKAIEAMRRVNIGRPNPMKGKKLSELVRQKIISRTTLEIRRKGAFASLKKLSERKMTDIERIVNTLLLNRGETFETQKVINNKFMVDFYLPRINLVIEADGDYWHSLERIVKKDKAENAYLKKCGFNLERWRGVDITKDINNLSKRLDLYS